MEHTRWLGILLGVNLQYGLTTWHKHNIEHLVHIEAGTFELRKDKIYERNYHSKYYIVDIIESQVEKTD